MKKLSKKLQATVITIGLCLPSLAQVTYTGTTNSGTTSSAIGNNTTASGSYSFAFGSRSTASGSYSVAGGNNSKSGAYSVAFGNWATASGDVSVALGDGAVASGNRSYSLGRGVNANVSHSTVLGTFNAALTGSSTSWVATDPLLVIGNGQSSSSRSTAMTILKNGNVGIGTTPGSTNLKVYGETNPSFELASPLARLQIGAATCDWCYAAGSKSGDIVFRPLGSQHGMIFYLPNDNGDGKSYIKFGDDKNKLWMSIFNDRTFRVDGTMYVKELEVKANVWADYVFDDKYMLPKLEEIEEHINANKHLPGIPSEAEVLNNGFDVAEMNALLLQKIEELTLYVIDQNKRIKELEAANRTSK